MLLCSEGRFSGKRTGNFLTLLGFLRTKKDHIIDLIPGTTVAASKSS